MKDFAELSSDPNTKFLINLRFHDLRHEATSRPIGATA